MEKWYSGRELRNKFKISYQTLYQWRKNKKIIYKNLSEKTFIYQLPSFLKEENEKLNLIYCRVSNTKQKEDLLRQEKFLKEYVISNGFYCFEYINLYFI